MRGSDNPPHPSRRQFLQSSAAISAAGLSLALPARSARARPREKPIATNLIFMVADGMSHGTLALGDLLSRRLHNKRSNWINLMQHERVSRALIDTHSADSFVTDSAAASSAWSIGSLVNNGAIAITPDGAPVTPLWLRAKESGRATGLVTTTRVTHATPAGFAANVPLRSSENDIAAQLIDRKYDLILGGGARHFTALDLSGHTVARTREELNALDHTNTNPILGLFADAHMSFDIERPEHEPSLEEMTRFALRHLAARNAGGFTLQIEGGRVDHAAHNNDAGALLHDQLAFDRAVATAAEFALSRDNTLLIITTDHATANPALTDYTAAGARGFDRILGSKNSFEWIEAAVSRTNDRSAEALAAIVESATALTIEAHEAQVLARWIDGEKVDPFALAGKGYGPLGSVLANHTAIAFLSPNHTSDFVELTALGPGADRIPPCLQINEVHDVIRAALDLSPAKPM